MTVTQTLLIKTSLPYLLVIASEVRARQSLIQLTDCHAIARNDEANIQALSDLQSESKELEHRDYKSRLAGCQTEPVEVFSKKRSTINNKI